MSLYRARPLASICRDARTASVRRPLAAVCSEPAAPCSVESIHVDGVDRIERVDGELQPASGLDLNPVAAACRQREIARALELDQALWQLDRRNRRADRVLGLGMVRILQRDGYRQIGFVRFADFVREHVRIGDSHGRWLRQLARSIDACPEAGAALDAGRLSASKVVELGRLTRLDLASTERGAWIALAEALPVRELRAAIGRAVATQDASSPDAAAESTADGAEDEGVMVSVGAPSPVLELWRLTMELARRVTGFRAPVHVCVEAIVGDFFSRAGDVSEEADTANGIREPGETDEPGESDAPGESAQRGPGVTARSVVNRRASETTGDRQERWPMLDWSHAAGRDDDLSRVSRSDDPYDLAENLRELSRRRTLARLEFAGLLEEQHGTRGWSRLGFESFAQYCEVRLGITRRHAEKLIRFKRSLDRFQHLRRAFQAGEVCYSGALCLLTILHESNEEAWVRWAAGASVRDLQRAVECAALYVRPGPPRMTTSPLARANTSAVAAGGTVDGSAASPGPSRPSALPGALARANTFAHAWSAVPGAFRRPTADALVGSAGDRHREVDFVPAGDVRGDLDVATGDGLSGDGVSGDGLSGDGLSGDGQSGGGDGQSGGGDGGPHAAPGAEPGIEPDGDPELTRLPAGYSLPPGSARGHPRIAGFPGDLRRRPSTRIVGRIRFWAPTETACQLHRALRRARQLLGGDGPDWHYLQVILVQFIQGQDTPMARRQLEEFKILARDDFECQVPTCTSCRHLHEHHLWYRGFGGCDEPWNQAGMCAGHHLFGEHGKTLRIGGWAPDNLFVVIGRPGLLDVRNGMGILHAFHNGRRADPAFVWKALNRWAMWWRMFRRPVNHGLLTVPTGPLTPETLEALSRTFARCFRIVTGASPDTRRLPMRSQVDAPPLGDGGESGQAEAQARP